MVFQKVICVGILHETNFNLFFIIHVIVILDNKLIDKCLYYVIHIHMSYILYYYMLKYYYMNFSFQFYVLNSCKIIFI